MNITAQDMEKANVPATQADIGSYAAACPDRKALVRYPVMGINTKPLKKRIQMIISIIVPYMGAIISPPLESEKNRGYWSALPNNLILNKM